MYIHTVMSSTSERNLELTDIRASCGHSWNQSIQVQLTTAGNLRPRTLNVVPTGEKHNTTCQEIHVHVHVQYVINN